jgi:hypothetical protein
MHWWWTGPLVGPEKYTFRKELHLYNGSPCPTAANLIIRPNAHGALSNFDPNSVLRVITPTNILAF